jgi:hypothetical protein
MTFPSDGSAVRNARGTGQAKLSQALFFVMQCSLLSLGCVFGFAAPEAQSSLTALRALKIAQRRLRPEVRSKLLSVSSPRTGNTLVPEAWRFVFLDTATSDHSRMVTVAAKTSSEHPDTVEAFSSEVTGKVSGLQVVPQNKWTFDSDAVLEKVRFETQLKGIRSAQYRLTQPKGAAEPLWFIQLLGDNDQPVIQVRIGAKTSELEKLASTFLVEA